MQTQLSWVAGAGGIEPTLTVLETVVLPLYDAPIGEKVYKAPSRLELALQTTRRSSRATAQSKPAGQRNSTEFLENCKRRHPRLLAVLWAKYRFALCLFTNLIPTVRYWFLGGEHALRRGFGRGV